MEAQYSIRTQTLHDFLQEIFTFTLTTSSEDILTHCQQHSSVNLPVSAPVTYTPL
jgi:hypothetical protein